MATAALTRSRKTRGLYWIVSLMCLVCFANSMGMKEQLEKMKVQLREIEQKIERGKANIELERKRIFEIMDGNTARMKCIRLHSLASVPEMEYLEDYTESTNANARKSFADMAAKMQELDSKLEDMKAKVKYFEHFHSEL